MYNIFCIWSGNNAMSDHRKQNLQSIATNSKCDVRLITENNLSIVEIPDFPIHKAYNFLSFTHRSDYLRAYLMYHYGGGYTDIKNMKFNWVPYFDFLTNSKDIDFIGYAEKDPQHIASNNKIIQDNYYSLCGCGHFIFKPKTIFAKTWLNIVNSILDVKFDELQKYPGTYHPRAIYGGIFQSNDNNLYANSKYPLTWNEILGRVLHPLMFNNQNRYAACMPYIDLVSEYR